METIKNVSQLFVAANIAKTAIAGQVINDVTDLGNGEVAVVDPRNNVHLTTAGFPAGLDSFKLIQRSGTKLIHSDVVKAGTVKRFSITLPATFPKTQQVDYIGFNGTSGAIDTFTNNLFVVRLYILEGTKMGFMQQKIKEGFYKSASTTSQYTIALNLTKSLVANYSREPIQDIAFERVNSGAQTAVPTSADNFNFVKGSKYFTATDIDDATGTAALAVGDLLVIGATATSPVYKITAINTVTNTGTLDMEFQGATQTLADGALRVIVAASEGNYGIRISGVNKTYDGKFFGDPVTWKTAIDFSDAQATTVTNATAASPGTGNYDVLARLEKELQADEFVYRSEFYAPTDRTDILSGTTYDVVVIEYDGVIDSGLGSHVRSPKQIIVASAGNAAQTDVAAIGWLTILNTLIPTTWATPGTAALTPTA